MKNVLKARLRKNHLTKDNIAQVVVKGNLGMTDIVDELIKEGLEINRDIVLDILIRFNTKSADMALSGYNVNTGLVNIRSSIVGPIYGTAWNQNINSVNVILSQGKELVEAIANSSVELLNDMDEPVESYNLSELTNQFSGSGLNNPRYMDSDDSRLKIIPEPACGIAFRRWLCKS